MTKNQIDYWSLKETQRSNRAKEEQARNELAETQRHALASERLTGEANLINKAHYERGDAINLSNYEESVRSHKANEAINSATQREVVRHNQATEAQTNKSLEISSATQQEVEKHNRITEQQTNSDLQRKRDELAESIRSHKANETINETANAINAQNAVTNRLNSEINRYNAETNRINANTNIKDVDSQIQRRDIQNTTDVVSWDKTNSETDLNKAKTEEAKSRAKNLDTNTAYTQKELDTWATQRTIPNIINGLSGIQSQILSPWNTLANVMRAAK